MTEERPENLRAARLHKLDALRARGIEPFADRFARSHSVADAISLFESTEATGGEEARTTDVALAGRVMRHRSQGKAAFADIVDETGKLQLYCHADGADTKTLELFNELDLGDIVGVEGAIFR